MSSVSTKKLNHDWSKTLKDNSLLQTNAFINGEWVKNENTFEVCDPGEIDSSKGLLCNVSNGNKYSVKEAIDVAYKTFDTWSITKAEEKSKILKEISKLHLDHIEDLAKILTLENGKPLEESKIEIKLSASYFEWFGEQCKRSVGEVIPPEGDNKEFITYKQPVGVVGIISPWNFPSAMQARAAAAAIAAGCTMVCKPASSTPLSALVQVELARRAGLPKGVMNIVPASSDHTKEIGEELATNEKIRKISFTGSTEVGRILLEQGSKTVKRTSMELGGNAAFIVFDDADIDQAIEALMDAKFGNCGQTCISANRVFVHESIHFDFVNKVKEKVEKLVVGHCLYGGKNKDGKDVNVGPLINKDAIKKIKDLLSDAESKGSKLIIGGKEKDGQYFEPTIILAKPNMDIYKKEIFGPVLAIYKFHKEEDVVKQANDTEFGLASYFFTKDVGRTFRVAKKLKFGMIGVNTNQITTAQTPFGGVKESGMGKCGSEHGLDDYLEIKLIAIQHSQCN